MGYKILGPLHRRVLFIILLAAVAVLTLAAALRYSTPLAGIPDATVQYLDTGWYYEGDGGLSALPQLPCHLQHAGDTLVLVRDLSDVARSEEDVLAISTRYQSIRVWADQALIYEAAQGRTHALSSMWHFIATSAYGDADTLRVELTKYDGNSDWQLFSMLQDHPDTIGMYLLQIHLPSILVWLCCMLFTLLLGFVMVFMAVRKIAGIPLVLALASFIFLSGMWILLDSKVTTLLGGNYALTYFFSYCVFYLMPVPLLFYFQLILELKNRYLRYLLWITAGNAGLWMLLHLLDLVPIRSTTMSVHLLIIIILIVFIREFFHKRENRAKNRLICTFWGISLIFAVALASIGLYHAGLLPPTNSAVLYAWGLLVLILCMTMDAVLAFGRIWKEKQYMEFYRQLATQDSMTKLANRNAYELRLQHLMDCPPAEVSFIFFDIDQMKDINDTYGHNAGDRVIRLVARCIREVFGNAGECYRIGGDEFCVIYTSQVEIPQKLQQFDALIAAYNQSEFVVTVSHGWERRNFQADSQIMMKDIADIKAAADRNLYRDKKAVRSDS